MFRYAAVRCGLVVVVVLMAVGCRALEGWQRVTLQINVGWGWREGGGRHDYSLVTLSPLCSSKRFCRKDELACMSSSSFSLFQWHSFRVMSESQFNLHLWSSKSCFSLFSLYSCKAVISKKWQTYMQLFSVACLGGFSACIFRGPRYDYALQDLHFEPEKEIQTKNMYSFKWYSFPKNKKTGI